MLGSTVDLLRTREADLQALLTGTMRAELSYFLFQCLFPANPKTSRQSAAEALGYLSKSNLDAVVLLFTKELQGAKDFKEYVTYQRAVPQACRFALDKTLVKYLTFLLGYESKDKNLFMAIAQTLIDVMNLNHASVAIPEIADDELRTSLVNVLYRFYEGAGKNWYKNAKTRLYSFKIQVFLYSLFDIQKMDLQKKDFIKLLQDMLRDAKYRREAIEEYSGFLRSLPSEFARGNSGKVWKMTVSELLQALFVKKAKEVEVKELTAVLTEILRLDLNLLQSEVLMGVIRSNDFAIEARSLVLKCIGSAVVQSPDKSIGESLQTTVTPIMLQYLSNSNMFEQLCLCFPHLVIPEKRRQVASLLLPSALSSNPEQWTPSLQVCVSLALPVESLTASTHRRRRSSAICWLTTATSVRCWASSSRIWDSSPHPLPTRRFRKCARCVCFCRRSSTRAAPTPTRLWRAGPRCSRNWSRLPSLGR